MQSISLIKHIFPVTVLLLVYVQSAYAFPISEKCRNMCVNPVCRIAISCFMSLQICRYEKLPCKYLTVSIDYLHLPSLHASLSTQTHPQPLETTLIATGVNPRYQFLHLLPYVIFCGSCISEGIDVV